MKRGRNASGVYYTFPELTKRAAPISQSAAGTSTAASKRARTPTGSGSKSEQEASLPPPPPPPLLTLSDTALLTGQDVKQVLTAVRDDLSPHKRLRTESVIACIAPDAIPLAAGAPPLSGQLPTATAISHVTISDDPIDPQPSSTLITEETGLPSSDPLAETQRSPHESPAQTDVVMTDPAQTDTATVPHVDDPPHETNGTTPPA